MIGDSFDSKLDRLLAQPPQMADRGFSSHVQQRLKRVKKQKFGVFTAMCFLWLLLLGLTTTPGQLLSQFSLASDTLARILPTPEDYILLRELLLNDPLGGSLPVVALVATGLFILGFGNLLRR